MHSRLGYLAIVGHIQQYLPLLTTLAERWDLDTNSFHFTPSEMSVTLIDVYMIWGIFDLGLAYSSNQSI